MPHPYPYQEIDRFVYLNQGDPSLFPIEIDQLDLIQRTYRQYNQPEPKDFPAMELVDGYGLPPEDQKFQREVIPVGLIELEKSIRKAEKPQGKARDLSPVRRELKIINTFWDELEQNQEKYIVEIEWLEKIWAYRLLGKFFFCNGKMTYIPGAYFYFLNFWYLKNILPEYRDRDRRWSIGLKYCEVCTTTFKDIDPDTGLPIKNEYGTYDMIDTGKRTLFGANFPKARRVGDTSRIEGWFTEFATRKENGNIGIQGMSDENASTVFSEHMVHPVGKLPIFLRPLFDAAGGIVPKNSMMLDDFEDPELGLHTIIDFATSSNKSKYDGKYLHRYHLDEGGKMERSDINDVISVVKFCLATGAGGKIHGLGAITTTVDIIEDQSAGERFMSFCAKSHFECRNANGRTQSGFVNFFFSSPDGLEDYIGPYGESIIGTPTPDQARFIGKTYGATKFIENEIASFRRAKDWKGLSIFRRQHPITYLDCFSPSPSQQVLRRDLIEAQIQLLQTHPELAAVRGDFYWVGGIVDGTVGWLPNPESGRFYLSRSFLPGETNRKVLRNGSWCPAVMDKFVGSPDTFAINSPLGRKSNGGLVIRWRRDLLVDPLDKEIDQLESERDIVTYKFRPDTVDEFTEDMLMAHVYVGGFCYPERNRQNIAQHYRRRGYEGFLLADCDRVTGKPKPEPGWYNQSGIIDAAIRWLQDDVVKHVKRCYHMDLLKEYLEFGGPATITNLDLIAAKLGTLIAERNPFYTMVKSTTNHINVEGFIPGYDG